MLLLQSADNGSHCGGIVLTDDLKSGHDLLRVLVKSLRLDYSISVIDFKAYAGVNINHDNAVLRHRQACYGARQRHRIRFDLDPVCSHDRCAHQDDGKAGRDGCYHPAIMWVSAGCPHGLAHKLFYIFIFYRPYMSKQFFAFQSGIPSFIKCFLSLFRSLKSIVVVFETEIS